MKRSPIYFSLIFLLSAISSHSQVDAVLSERLRGKSTFAEIMTTVKTYYKDPATLNRLSPDAVNRSLKHWRRFEWYMGRRLGPNGEFVNINKKLVEATGLQARTAGRTDSHSGAWTPVGPMDTESGIGRVDRLAFHPTDPNTVYAGSTAGGLWKTTNAGTNWTNISPEIPSGGISGILIDPGNTNIIYILTGDGDSDFGGLVDDYGYMRLSIGVLKSTNGGANWSPTGIFPGADYNTLTGYRLVMHPTDNNIIYACTSQGIYMSPNAGTSWVLINGGGRFYNMKFKPGSGTVCYAVSTRPDYTRASFWKSTNSGLSWDSTQVVNNLINNPTRRVELAVAPSNPDRVYLLAGGVPPQGPGNPVPNIFRGFYMSPSEGDFFIQQSNTPNILGRSTTGVDAAQQSNYDLALAVSNVSAVNVVAGAINVWQSPTSGTAWNFRGNLHGDIHDLGFHPADDKLWAATDGGVYSSIDNGQNWTSHFADMNTTQFYRLAVSPADYLNMIAGCQDNAVKRKTGNTTYFDQIACCDGFALGYDPTNVNTIFAVTNQSINISVNGGNTFTPVNPLNSNNPFSMSMAVHSTQANSLFIGSDSVFSSTNGGASWNLLSIQGGGWFLRTCPSNSTRVYVAGGDAYNVGPGNLRRSDNSGVGWIVLSNNPGFPNNFPRITSINVNPTNSNQVWVTFGGFTDGVKVFYSNDAGANWVDRSGSLPNVPVNCIALDNSNNAYLGTDNGVYYRGSSMTDWIPFYNNLPYVPVTDLIISEAENRIRAATFGRGIWSSDLYSACEVDLAIGGTLEGQEFYEASNSVTTTALLSTSVGTKVQMRGGNQVVLEPGFTARENTQFKAAIGPCGSSGAAGFRVSADDSSTILPARQFLPPPGGSKTLMQVEPVTGNEARISVYQKQPGIIELILTDEAGNILRRKALAGQPSGKWNNSINTSGLVAGTYFLNILLDKQVEHMQELVIK